jgi:hypothetical protein
MSISPIPSYVNKQGGFNVIPVDVIVGAGAPATTLKRPVGYFYYDTTNQSLYGSGGVVNNLGVWIALGGSSVAISNVLGTANQITSTVVGGVATLSLPAVITAPGSVSATTTLTATLGAITATNGNLVLGTAGNKLSIAAGANASIGTAQLVAGTVTVSTTAVTTNSKIFVTVGALGTVVAPQAMHVDAIVNATSFDITSADGTDTSFVNWLIIN